MVGYFFEGFQPQNVLLLILLSIEYSYLLTTKIVPDVKIRDISLKDRDIFVNGWLIGDIERFNANLEEYKIIYPNGKSDYIAKDVFDGVQVFFFVSKFLKEISIIIILIFLFLKVPAQMFLICSYYFNNVSLAVPIKFVDRKVCISRIIKFFCKFL